MSITYKGERQGSSSRQSGQITAERNLSYFLDDATDPSQIINDSNIPTSGAFHPTITGLYAGNVDAPQKDEGSEIDGFFIVTVHYSSNPGLDMSPLSIGEKPWKMDPTDISYTTREVESPMKKAYQDGDEQFKPTKPVIHPVTGEVLLASTIEGHGLISFTYRLKDFEYDWKRLYENTMNRNSMKLLGVTYPRYTLLLRSLSVTKTAFSVGAGSRKTYYWVVKPLFEDYHKEIWKELAYQGYTHMKDSKIRPIQLRNGVYGFFDENDTSLHVSTPRFVNASGVVLPSGGTVGDEHYGLFPDVFMKNWGVLSFPKEDIK